MKILDFLKGLFQSKNEYGMGALESPIDPRNISITQVQTPVQIPEKYKTDISMLPVENQSQLGTCVAQSHMKLIQYYFFNQTKSNIELSARAIYKWCKEIDGISTYQGTFPSVMAKIITKKGIPLASYAPNVNSLSHVEYLNITISGSGLKDASSRKLAGYVFVPADFELIKQAIYQNGVITGTTDVDSNWFIGIIRKVFKIVGRHSTLWIGYDKNGIYARNSWGTSWIAKITGMLLLGDGEFYFKWEEYKNNVYDIIAYLEIPEYLLQEAKGKEFQFLNDLKVGDTGYDVYKLQERLKMPNVTGYFGGMTIQQVCYFQIANNLKADGVVGRLTREKLNMKKSYLEDWILAIKIMEGAKPSRNNPGNLRYVGQKYAVNDKGFCKFDTYQHGYEALKKLLLRACSGNSTLYNANGNLLDFYKVYAPSSDGNNPVNYAKFVADRLGVSVETKIKNLI